MSRSRKTAWTLFILLVFGIASPVLADPDSQTAYGAPAERPASMMSTGRTRNRNDAAMPLRIEGDASSTASELRIVHSAPFRIRLTEPGGKLIHINVEHVTAVRSDTQIPGARAQLDLTSGKFQGVQEDVEQVMQLILAAPGTRENDEPRELL